MSLLAKIKRPVWSCPFCGEEVIRYHHRIRCWKLAEVRCPECGAMIKNEKKYRIIDTAAVAAVIILGFFSIIFGDGLLGCILLAVFGIYRGVAVFFAKLEYEADYKHPPKE